MIGRLLANLGPIPYSAQPQRVDLNAGVNIHGILLRLTGAVTITTGGGGSGTLMTEGVQRLLKAVRIRHDGDDRVSRISGRALHRLTLRTAQSVASPEQLANAGDQAATAISCEFFIPIAQPWLAEPALTCWPGSMPVKQELALYVEWETAVAGGTGSEAGTGALIDGGTRVVAFSTAPQLEVIQYYSTGNLTPWYMTRITAAQTTEQFTAANARLPYLLNGGRRITAILARCLEGGDSDAADLVNNLSLQASGGSLEFWDQVPFDVLRMIDRGNFPAAGDAPSDGELFALFVDNGRLATNFDPRPLNNPRLLYNVDTPASSPGYVDHVVLELDSNAYTSQPF